MGQLYYRNKEFIDIYLKYLDGKFILNNQLIHAMLNDDIRNYGKKFIKKCEDKGAIFLLITNKNNEFIELKENYSKLVVDISNLDVSHITDFSQTFYNLYDFNQDISKWDMSSAEDMSYMFSNARSFNTDIRNWNTANVTNMMSLFYNATSFNQPLEEWDVSNVVLTKNIFHYAFDFKQYIGTWNIQHPSIIPDINNVSFNIHNKMYEFTENRLKYFIEKYKKDTNDINKYKLMKYMKQYSQYNNDEFEMANKNSRMFML